MELDSNDLSEFYHRLLSPRVAALVVTLKEDMRPNVMVAAWHTPVSVRPPIVGVCIAPSRLTHLLIHRNREFTLNIPDLSMKDKVEAAGSSSGRDFDKSTLFKFAPSVKIRTPVIEGAIGVVECELGRTIDVGDHSVIFGNVVSCRAKGFWEVWRSESPLLHLGSNFYTVMKEVPLR
ncbi:MAG: flavin reductase family protein [Candidatus Verstraetearchaeota archaeon]|nr:flavin reductase family protein [Candidatus Verstraetearchaeota archaeon]